MIEEHVEIVTIGTALVARATWHGQHFDVELPHGIASWPRDEYMSHMRRLVVPRLKTMTARAKLAHAETAVEDVEPEIPPHSPADECRLQKAASKRARRAQLRTVSL